MKKLIVLSSRQSCDLDWEIELSSYDKSKILDLKSKLKKKGLKTKVEIFKPDLELFPYKITYDFSQIDCLTIKVGINLIKCLENDKTNSSEIKIRKSETNIQIYLFAIDEKDAISKSSDIYSELQSDKLRKNTIS